MIRIMIGLIAMMIQNILDDLMIAPLKSVASSISKLKSPYTIVYMYIYIYVKHMQGMCTS